MKLRVGVVGVGEAWPTRHLPALRALTDRYQVRAVCSEVSLLAEQAAREFEAATVDGYQALSARADIDAVLMLASAWYGPLPILAAAEAGKAVYCAAALDIAQDRAGEVKSRVEQSGVAFMAEFPRRQSPATLRLKELIATRLGAPRLVFCHQRLRLETCAAKNTPYQSPPATRTLMELVDWCCYVVGQAPRSVVGVRHRSPGDGRGDDNDNDYEMMNLDFSPPGSPGDGPTAQISCGHYMPATWHEAIGFRPPAAMQVCCENGIAFIDLPSSLVWFDEAGRHMESLDSERPVGEQMLTNFHRSVTSLVRKSTDLDDAYRALHVVLSARRSSAEGRRMPVS